MIINFKKVVISIAVAISDVVCRFITEHNAASGMLYAAMDLKVFSLQINKDNQK